MESLNTNNYYKNYYDMRMSLGKPTKGKLVRAPLLFSPKDDFSSSTKTINRAIKGKGTDWSLGKLNDLAITSGAAMIATVLAGAEKMPNRRAMEFVGAGMWLASMHLWPKVFLARPVKALTGVDLNLEYINAQNERKPFFLDHQYLPWDLLPQEELDKAGKKLNVPEKIENRNEEIQRRMRKVSVGTNTWWMLTAGFSTPFMASLMSNRMEKPVENLTQWANITRAEAQLEALGISTDSRSSFTHAGKKAIRAYDNLVGARAAKRADAALEKALKSGDLGAIKDFFGNRLRGEEFKGLLAKTLGEVENIFNGNPNNVSDIFDDIPGKLSSDATIRANQTQALKNLHKEATEVKDVFGAMNKYAKALENRGGIVGMRAKAQMLDILGFNMEELKQLANTGMSPAEKSELVAKRLINMTDASRESAILKINKVSEGTVQFTEEAADRLGIVARQVQEKYTKGALANVVTDASMETVQVAKDKVVGLGALRRVSRAVELAGDKSSETWDILAKGFKELGHDSIEGASQTKRVGVAVRTLGGGSGSLWGGISKAPMDGVTMVKVSNTEGFLKTLFGGCEQTVKKVAEFAKAPRTSRSVLSQETLNRRIDEWIGQSPMKMFEMVSDNVFNTKRWFRRIGGMGAGAVLASTATALLLITNNAKKAEK